MKKQLNFVAVVTLLLLFNKLNASAQTTVPFKGLIPQGQINDFFKAACAQGQMSYASNEYGSNEQTEPVTEKGEFTVLIDTKSPASNFVSFTEKYFRSQAETLDTTVFYLMYPKWKQMPAAQKLEIMNQQKVQYAMNADSIHKMNNIGHQLIYMVNHTNQHVDLQMQDWSFIGIVEAINNNNEWKPVQYWRYSKCGNSYALKDIAPQTTMPFIVRPLNTGDYKTRLRYKILGKDKFYYSNEFEGSINYCDFYDAAPGTDKLEAFVKVYH